MSSLAVMALTASFAATAGTLQITPAPACGEAIRVSAQQVPLSTVLRALSKSQGFALRLNPRRDPMIDRELRQPLPVLIKSLTRSQNLVLEDEPDPRCPGLRRITKVALLPEGHESAPPRLPPSATPPPMTEEQKEGLARYRRAHGLGEDGQPLKRLPPTPDASSPQP